MKKKKDERFFRGKKRERKRETGGEREKVTAEILYLFTC